MIKKIRIEEKARRSVFLMGHHLQAACVSRALLYMSTSGAYYDLKSIDAP